MAVRIAAMLIVVAAGMGLAFIASTRDGETGGVAPDRAIGLFTSLPIVWPEGGPSEVLGNDAPPHWVMAVLRERGWVIPLDRLASDGAPDGGGGPLGTIRLLVMAQPRALSPDENVALDDWVRGGGRVLLFADPMLTAHSAFALGDPRRPQDIAMLSPILTRWGLRLEFDDGQPAGERRADMLGMATPVDLAGCFAAIGDDGACEVLSAGLVARCPVGAGRVVAVADAALLEAVRPDDTVDRARAFGVLLKEATD